MTKNGAQHLFSLRDGRRGEAKGWQKTGTTGHSFRTVDWHDATGMVGRFLGQYDHDAELAKPQGEPEAVAASAMAGTRAGWCCLSGSLRSP